MLEAPRFRDVGTAPEQHEPAHVPLHPATPPVHAAPVLPPLASLGAMQTAVQRMLDVRLPDPPSAHHAALGPDRRARLRHLYQTAVQQVPRWWMALLCSPAQREWRAAAHVFEHWLQAMVARRIGAAADQLRARATLRRCGQWTRGVVDRCRSLRRWVVRTAGALMQPAV